MSSTPIIELNDVHKHFGPVPLRAVDGVSLALTEGETVGLVGESGCGKSTLGRMIVRLDEPTTGEIRFDGARLDSADAHAMRRFRRSVQMVFQDPYSSLNPRLTIGQSINRAWEINPGIIDRSDRPARIAELLEQVGLLPDRASWHPHQLSGGQRQRVAIARALALAPRLIVCDEPVSALDVSVQAQVLKLLRAVQSASNVSYLFVSHDLGIVESFAQRTLVMYLGRLIESGPSKELFRAPAHPYTAALVAAAPSVHRSQAELEERHLLDGDPPSPLAPPSGCRFRTRCPKAQPLCAEVDPTLAPTTNARAVACHFPLTSN
jgi:oligopeptide transport system ATP-binding protein